jgi:hypothetical protein
MESYSTTTYDDTQSRTLDGGKPETLAEVGETRPDPTHNTDEQSRSANGSRLTCEEIGKEQISAQDNEPGPTSEGYVVDAADEVDENPSGPHCPLWESIYRQEMPELTEELMDAYTALYPEYVRALKYDDDDLAGGSDAQTRRLENMVAFGLLASRDRVSGAFRWAKAPPGLIIAATMSIHASRAVGCPADRYALACGLVNDPAFTEFYNVDEKEIEEAMNNVIEHSDLPPLDDEERENSDHEGALVGEENALDRQETILA